MREYKRGKKQDNNKTDEVDDFTISGATLRFIIITFIFGLVLVIIAAFIKSEVVKDIMSNVGGGLIVTGLISIPIDYIWRKHLTQQEKEELQPIHEKLKNVSAQLEKLEGRTEAIKRLGFNNCYAYRNDALEKFYIYANELINDKNNENSTIDIVSSSARGLMGYIDRDPIKLQHRWRKLITDNYDKFHILLTHPSYAHLRRPAEERSSGDIELEILKTMIYLSCIAGMTNEQLRLYRGSPTVFAIQAGEHYLINPYPYGQMAMDTLCLEFESREDNSYIANFMRKHFKQTWAFFNQKSKQVDGKPLVEGINSFEDIMEAFLECTFVDNRKCLRFTEVQVEELDVFSKKMLEEMYKSNVDKTKDTSISDMDISENPFTEFAKNRGLKYSNPFCVKTERSSGKNTIVSQS